MWVEKKQFIENDVCLFVLKRIALLNKSEDEEIEDREMNEAELAELFAGLFVCLFCVVIFI